MTKRTSFFGNFSIGLPWLLTALACNNPIPLGQIDDDAGVTAGGSSTTGGAPTGGMPTTGGATAAGGVATTGGTAGCTEVPLWTQQSQGFTIRASGEGDYVVRPRADAGCPFLRYDYQVSLADRTLVGSECDDNGPFDHVVHLTQAGLDSVVAWIAAMHSSCALMCGADALDESITIQGTDGAQIYNSTFYAACLDWTLSPPFVYHADLWALEHQLHSLLKAVCEPTDAGSSNLGTCE